MTESGFYGENKLVVIKSLRQYDNYGLVFNYTIRISKKETFKPA